MGTTEHTVRLRLGPFGRLRLTLRGLSDAEAKRREAKLRDVAQAIIAAGHGEHAVPILRKAESAVSADAFRATMNVAEKLCAGKYPEGKAPKASKTFRMVGEWWTSGDAHRDFPDQVEDVAQSYLDTCAQRLEKAVYRHIGDKPIDQVTREDCDAVMRGLPKPKGKKALSKASRRHYAGLINRVLNLAELAGYVERNPLPRGWLPKLGAQKRYPILYPTEDRALLACKDVPLAYRVLYGFLHREGMRRGEAAVLEWRDVDLENGTLSLDENKTDHPRWWKLGDGVAAALAAWKGLLGDVEPSDRVFTDEHGRPLSLDHLADVVRGHLATAELSRADLTSEGPNKGPFGTHCFRRSFVTRNLALGKNEDWVRQRTGHKSEQLLRYRQAAKALAELDLGELDPLPLVLSGLPPDCHRGTSRRWRNWQTRWIQVPVG